MRRPNARRREKTTPVRRRNRPNAATGGARNRGEERRSERPRVCGNPAARGAPLQRLAKEIQGFAHVDVPVGTLDITLYRDDLSTVGPQPIVQSTDIDFAVDDRDLVVVDDVLYTGRTIRAAMNGLFDLGRPRRIRLCVLIDRGHRELPVEATFIGNTVQTSDSEIVEVRLQEIDDEERVMLVDRVS